MFVGFTTTYKSLPEHDYHINMTILFICIFQKDSLRYAEILNKAIDLNLFSPQYVTALGYSLGGQISGHVCRNLHGKCGSILGNHPAHVFRTT